MRFLYSIGIRFYHLMAFLLSPFNKKAKQFYQGRLNWRSNLGLALKNNNKKVVWFHVSSLGEFEQGRPIIEELKSRYNDLFILLTFFSPSGYEIRKNYEQADYICYLPADTKKNACDFIQTVQPNYTIFVKYDFWYHFIKQSSLSGSKLMLVSGLFRENQVFFKWWASWYRSILHCFDHLFLQDEKSALLANKIKLRQYSVAGDSRMDRVIQIASSSQEIDLIKQFSENNFTIIGGSTWPPDEDLLSQFLNKSQRQIKLILAPHHIGENHIKQIENQFKGLTLRYSEANENNIQDKTVLIIDCIGLLSTIYRYGQIAYIGGGFGVSIHNTLEPAVYGIPVIFGPKYKKFKEAVDLIERKGGFSVFDYNDLETLLINFLDDKTFLNHAGTSAGNYIKEMSGATKKIMAYFSQLNK
ncbi:MAG: 3-deoxy-D-manno-octulosonic acid transferase [Bacteroidales bacterium]|nr:3-deoxy-D-manno-octulosonic acid transferase [Bacteroidales bacterium]